jgi:hypothetical protein
VAGGEEVVVGSKLIDAVSTWLAGPKGQRDLLLGVDIDDGIGVFADSEHR